MGRLTHKLPSNCAALQAASCYFGIWQRCSRAGMTGHHRHARGTSRNREASVLRPPPPVRVVGLMGTRDLPSNKSARQHMQSRGQHST